MKLKFYQTQIKEDIIENMKIAALLTARNGSKSVPNKNLYLKDDIPLYQWNVQFAEKSKYIQKVYITTDIPEIFSSKEQGIFKAEVIKRPAKLCQDNSSHHETILHGLEIIEDELGSLDYLVVLLGNAPFAFTDDLDKAIQLFHEARDKYDSCQSVGIFNQFNPFRSFHKLNSTGELKPIINPSITKFLQNKKNSNDKNAFGDIYFFNGAFWIMKVETLRKADGDSVFPWLGQRILPYVQDSKYQEVDAPWQLQLL